MLFKIQDVFKDFEGICLSFLFKDRKPRKILIYSITFNLKKLDCANAHNIE